MAFYLKNLHQTFVTVAVGHGELTIRPGKIIGPLVDEDMTRDVISKAKRRIVSVIRPTETAEEDKPIEPESDEEPGDIENVESEEL